MVLERVSGAGTLRSGKTILFKSSNKRAYTLTLNRRSWLLRVRDFSSVFVGITGIIIALSSIEQVSDIISFIARNFVHFFSSSETNLFIARVAADLTIIAAAISATSVMSMSYSKLKQREQLEDLLGDTLSIMEIERLWNEIEAQASASAELSVQLVLDDPGDTQMTPTKPNVAEQGDS